MPVTLAAGNGLRTNAACSIPARVMSPTNRPRPCSRRRSSLRVIGAPTQRPSQPGAPAGGRSRAGVPRCGGAGSPGGRGHSTAACARARDTSVAVSRLRYSLLPWLSEEGSTWAAASSPAASPGARRGRLPGQGAGVDPGRQRPDAADDHVGGPDRPVGDVGAHGGGDDREVPRALRELGQHGAPGRPGEPHLGDHLVRGRVGRVVPLQELRCRDGALPARPVQHDLRPEQHGEQAPLRGRVGVGDAAAERAAGPDRVVPDPPRGPGEHAEVPAHRRVRGGLDRPVRGQRPDVQPVRVRAQVGQAGDPGHVDQRARPGQPEVHHRDQAEPARQDLGLVAEFAQQGDRLGHAAGPAIGERGWFHPDSHPSGSSSWPLAHRSARGPGLAAHRSSPVLRTAQNPASPGPARPGASRPFGIPYFNMSGRRPRPGEPPAPRLRPGEPRA